MQCSLPWFVYRCRNTQRTVTEGWQSKATRVDATSFPWANTVCLAPCWAWGKCEWEEDRCGQCPALWNSPDVGRYKQQILNKRKRKRKNTRLNNKLGTQADGEINMAREGKQGTGSLGRFYSRFRAQKHPPRMEGKIRGTIRKQRPRDELFKVQNLSQTGLGLLSECENGRGWLACRRGRERGREGVNSGRGCKAWNVGVRLLFFFF